MGGKQKAGQKNGGKQEVGEKKFDASVCLC